MKQLEFCTMATISDYYWKLTVDNKTRYMEKISKIGSVNKKYFDG